jgi:hypothetical protein
MRAGFGVDRLHVDAHSVAAALHAAFEHVAHVELAANLLQVDRLARELSLASCGKKVRYIR